MVSPSLLTQRRSGILAHISSLPSPFGIGDLGPTSYSFLDFLQKSGQSIWQILPLGPTSEIYSYSPYMSASAFAGNALFISPEKLIESGLLKKNDIPEIHVSPYTVDFFKAAALKKHILQKAFSTFQNHSRPQSYEKFSTQNSWVQEYAHFMALKEHFRGQAWFQWPADFASCRQESIRQSRKELSEKISFYIFEQFVFFLQWQELHAYAQERSVLIFGDIPIYVSHDSADVWAHQSIFQLTKDGTPLAIAGVPPDYFSDTGQRWGNPLYRWHSTDKKIESNLLSWWRQRFSVIFSMVDVARIDHFRGFDSYWSIPANEQTAIHGTWEKGPGSNFFQKIFAALGPLEIVAEDLGEITESVLNLRDHLGFPGMKILQFAFDGNCDNSFLPFNFTTPNCIIYTGTHDNNTTVGWYLGNEMDDFRRSLVKRYANRDADDHSSIHADMLHLALSSIANTAITPLQDILGFGGDCRMNTPGTTEGNWKWRCSDEFLTNHVANWLKELTTRFNRLPPANKTQRI